jgi:hypothetical protein
MPGPCGARYGGAVDAPAPYDVFDAFPTPTLVVDRQLRVIHRNAAARGIDGAADARAGDLLGCAHAAPPGACGEGEACGGCPLAEAVLAALETGVAVRRRAVLEVRGARGREPAPYLVGAAPLEPGSGRAVLNLEDVTELTALRALWSSVCTGAARRAPAQASGAEA